VILWSVWVEWKILWSYRHKGIICKLIFAKKNQHWSKVMSLNSEDVNRIAHLARLTISEQDVPQYAKNLSDILSFVAQMNAVDTAGVAPMAHPQDAVQRLRHDEVTERNEREHFQRISPQAESGLYLVPKVIE
jgi:aspartyl-tRNA(Asn)/glutamyl-tRNA(Gln) amidotransferase subunit C